VISDRTFFACLVVGVAMTFVPWPLVADSGQRLIILAFVLVMADICVNLWRIYQGKRKKRGL
jgi:hypothetical protein